MGGPSVHRYRLLLALWSGGLLRQGVSGSSGFSGDDSGRRAAEQSAEPQCQQGAAFTQMKMRRKDQPSPQEPYEQDQPVHVAYTVNRHVFNATLRSLVTLSLYSKAPKLIVHLLVPEGDVEQAEVMVQCLSKQLDSVSDLNGSKPEVEISTLQKMAFQIDYRHDGAIQEGGLASSARLFLSEYLLQVKRVLYLDSDTLFLTDITPLYHRRLSNSLAAAWDWGSYEGIYQWADQSALKHYVNVSKSLFNDGVLLLDLDRWRQDNISGSLAELAFNVESAMQDDQLLLNLEYQGRRGGFDQLESKWNTFVGSNDMHIHYNDQLLHFFTNPKPWDRSDWANRYFYEQFRKYWTREGTIDASSPDCAGFHL